jgi:hypothetical protein
MEDTLNVRNWCSTEEMDAQAENEPRQLLVSPPDDDEAVAEGLLGPA